MTSASISRSILWVAVLALIVTACSATDQEGGATTSTSLPTTTQPDTPTTPATPSPSEASFTTSEGWATVTLGQGTKPDLSLDPDGKPGVTWLFEALSEGFVAYTDSASDWTTEVVLEGYFYGPIGLAYDTDGVPNIAIHDHQAGSFNPELGDLTRLFRDDGGWTVDPAEDEGHDGWDSTIRIDGEDRVHAAGVDPSQFGRTEGVEYYLKADDSWQVTQIGSGPIAYQFNVSLDLDAAGQPGISFYNDTDGDLVFAQLEDGAWTLERPATEGDVGKYSSLAFDTAGQPSISFFRQTSASEGEIAFTQRIDGEWTSEVVGSLSAFEGNNARRNSSLAFDSQNRAHVVFSDTSGVWYSVRSESGWETQQIVEAGRPLGQLVSLAIDGDDTPHIAFYEVTETNPLDGIVAYLTTR